MCATTSDLVTFHVAVPSDYPEIARLAYRIWPVAYADIISGAQIDFMLEKAYSPEQLRADQEEGIRFVFVCWEEMRIGFFAFGPTHTQEEAMLHKVYLLPEFHGQGIGSKLLQESIRRAREVGYQRLVLAVNRRNEKGLRAYYRNGFVKRSEVLTEIGHGFVKDDFILVRDLTEI